MANQERDLHTKIIEYLLSFGRFRIEDIREKVFSFSDNKDQVLSILSNILDSNLFQKRHDCFYIVKV